MSKRWRSPYAILAFIVPLVGLAFSWRFSYDQFTRDSDPVRNNRIAGMTQLFADSGWTSPKWNFSEVSIPKPGPHFDYAPDMIKFKRVSNPESDAFRKRPDRGAVIIPSR